MIPWRMTALIACLPLAGAAQTEETPTVPARPRLALALSGGGARGMAHVGALRALEEAGLPVDAIAANSIGAVVGGVYATGRTASELEEVVRDRKSTRLNSSHLGISYAVFC